MLVLLVKGWELSRRPAQPTIATTTNMVKLRTVSGIVFSKSPIELMSSRRLELPKVSHALLSFTCSSCTVDVLFQVPLKVDLLRLVGGTRRPGREGGDPQLLREGTWIATPHR